MHKHVPLSLYIHFPWCVKKCPYCDFNSHALRGELPETAYIDALLTDLDETLVSCNHKTLHSIFMGGGTPSLFSPDSIARLLEELKKRLLITPEIEITLEANPGTVEYQKFKAFKDAGINRLSIGVQSFQTDKLTVLGRIHDGNQAIQAIQSAHNAGFTDFNVDLMYGLPNQSVSDALADLNTAIDLSPTHISWYHLTLEPNTVFYRQVPANLPDDDKTEAMETAGRALLEQHGYHRYEVSAYAKNNHQSRHNMNYWQFGDYIGIGAGAHGKLTDAHSFVITRSCKQRVPKNYMHMSQDTRSNQRILSTDDKILEFMLNALRLTQGFHTTLFTQHTGLPLTVIEKPLERALAKGYVEHKNDIICPTEYGQRFF